MVDIITTLIEKAIQTDNDQEALSVLRQVRKLYRGTGSVVMPRRVRRQQEVTVPAMPTVSQSDHDKIVADYENLKRKLVTENQKLFSENSNLSKKVLEGNFATDEKLLDEAAATAKRSLLHVVSSWTITAVLAVTLFVILVF